MNTRQRFILCSAAVLIATPAPLVGCASSSSRGGKGRAIAEIDPALELAQRRRREALAVYQRASKLHAAGKLEQALEAYRQALDLDDQLYAAWNNMGQLLMLRGNYSDAVSAYQIASRIEPTDPRPQYNIGLAYQRVGWAKDAYTHFEIALDRDPSYMPALRGLVRAAELMGRGDPELLKIIRKAQLMENDEEWREYFLAQSFRVESMIDQTD